MTIDSTSISWVHPGTGIYRPGDVIQGVMTLVITGDRHNLSELLVKIRGLAKTHWKTSSGSGKNRRTKTHQEELWLMREDIYFIRGPARESLAPGTYTYPFSHTLRHGLPPSYESQYGKISYMCKARAISSDLFSFNSKTDYVFTVLPVLDLNAKPQLAEPVAVSATADTSTFGHAIGDYTLRMNRSGFTGGERISITITGPDRLFEKQQKSDGVVKLKKCVLNTAHSRTREEKYDLAEVHPYSSRGWRSPIELTVPNHERMTIDSSMCRIVTVSYYIKIHSRHITMRIPVTIGTVPFVSSNSGSQAWGSPSQQLQPRGSPQTWRPSPAPSPSPHVYRPPQREMFSPSAPAAPAASMYDPPPSYSEVMAAEKGAMGAEKGAEKGEKKEEEGPEAAAAGRNWDSYWTFN